MLRFAPLLLATGCSFAFVRGPADDAAARCTSSPGLPIADGVSAAASLGLGVLAATHVARHEYGGSRGDELQKKTDTTAAVGLLIAGAAYTGSAVYGFHRVHACSRGY